MRMSLMGVPGAACSSFSPSSSAPAMGEADAECESLEGGKRSIDRFEEGACIAGGDAPGILKKGIGA